MWLAARRMNALSDEWSKRSIIESGVLRPFTPVGEGNPFAAEIQSS
jgi:hypothetical protein